MLAILIVLSACKKEKTEPVAPTTPTVATGTRDELTKDSIFLYAKEFYYWNTSLPTYDAFKPRSYSTNEAELFAITQFSNDPTTGKPYEYVSGSTTPKYSFIESVSTGTISSLKADINGSASDYGFSLLYNDVSDLRVKYVYPNSSAAQQGLQRGFKITAINGRTNLTYSSSTVAFLNSALFGTNSTINLTFTDLNGVSKSVVVSNTTYTVNPILYTNVYTIGTKKVGYIVFNSFTNNVTSALTSTFSTFASQGVTEMVVDLRYNGGGYVTTATQLINILAPSAQTGSTMFTYYYNAYLQGLTTAQRKTSILAHQPLLDDNGKLQTFTTGVNGKYATYADLNYSNTSADNIEKFSKTGTLNLSRIYFIVTDATASASELTVNSLKPVMDVKLIGSTTYGKPVGFFPIRIDKIDLYIPEFETKNQAGVGGYYSGMTVDKEGYEDLTKSWGDETETLLGYALQYARTGSFITTAAKTASLTAGSTKMPARLSSTQLRALSGSLDEHSFKGMVAAPKGRVK